MILDYRFVIFVIKKTGKWQFLAGEIVHNYLEKCQIKTVKWWKSGIEVLGVGIYLIFAGVFNVICGYEM